jgi:hypothetical protein
MSPLPRVTLVVFLGLLAACGDGQPLFDETPAEPDPDVDGNDDGDGDGDGDLDSGPELPPGTEEPSPRDGILRYEAENETGGGFVTNVSYDARTDTFTVDNLGFDGANVYSRGESVSTMGGFAVYEADVEVDDFLTGDAIDQLVPYRAILGISDNTVGGEARTSFAIVRTGGYVSYGFGGFVYERNGEVVLPSSGQAQFSGDYAGIRVFSGNGGLEYTRADMTMAIDFEDFNDGAAVRGRITNREAFDDDGNPIALGGVGQLVLPNLNFVIQAGESTLNENGEIVGSLASFARDETGALVEYEVGTYYALIAGDTTNAADGGEIVGVVVVESDDPRFEGVTAQETGGFILYR